MAIKKSRHREPGAGNQLTHVDAKGRIRMVDVGDKAVTDREAIARGSIAMSKTARRLIAGGNNKKGDPIQAARLAGIMAAKKTSELIPLCHPLNLSHVSVDLTPNRKGYDIEARVRIFGKTGVEMEALVGASVAALTVYDMCKALSHDIVIKETKLIAKTGGKRDFKRA